MTKFEKFTLVLMSIAILVVATANSFVNYEQTERIRKLSRQIEILEATVDTEYAESLNLIRSNRSYLEECDSLIIEAIRKLHSEGDTDA